LFLKHASLNVVTAAPREVLLYNTLRQPMKELPNETRASTSLGDRIRNDYENRRPQISDVLTQCCPSPRKTLANKARNCTRDLGAMAEGCDDRDRVTPIQDTGRRRGLKLEKSRSFSRTEFF